MLFLFLKQHQTSNANHRIHRYAKWLPRRTTASFVLHLQCLLLLLRLNVCLSRSTWLSHFPRTVLLHLSWNRTSGMAFLRATCPSCHPTISVKALKHWPQPVAWTHHFLVYNWITMKRHCCHYVSSLTPVPVIAGPKAYPPSGQKEVRDNNSNEWYRQVNCLKPAEGF